MCRVVLATAAVLPLDLGKAGWRGPPVTCDTSGSQENYRRPMRIDPPGQVFTLGFLEGRHDMGLKCTNT